MFWTIILAILCYDAVSVLLQVTIKVLRKHLRWVNDEGDTEEDDSPYAGRDYNVDKKRGKDRKNMIGFGE